MLPFWSISKQLKVLVVLMLLFKYLIKREIPRSSLCFNGQSVFIRGENDIEIPLKHVELEKTARENTASLQQGSTYCMGYNVPKIVITTNEYLIVRRYLVHSCDACFEPILMG